MLSSIPVALQAVLWPLVGAAIIVALNRLLPHWLGRVLAFAASFASLAALWTASVRGSGWFQSTWEPFTFLRSNPALLPTPLGLLAGIALATWTAVAALGIRGSQHPRTTWYGLNLVSLAGCVLLCLSANLLTLALGSALIDLALLAIAVSAVGGSGQSQRVSWRMCVPGLVSTGLLLVASLRQDTSTGSLSLLAQGFTPQVLGLLAAAGLLRLMVYPVHPRGLKTPEQAGSLILSMGAGIYLLSRTLALGPTPAGMPWLLAIGAIALLAGGWLSWTAGIARGAPREWPDVWAALAANQAGVAILFVIVLPGTAPWPLVSLILALGLLVVWWDTSLEHGPESLSARWEWIGQRWLPVRERLRSWARGLRIGERAEGGEAPPSAGIMGRIRRTRQAHAGRGVGWLGRLRGSWAARRGSILVPALALASLAGLPLTAGGVTRWHLYGALLARNRPVLLATLWIGDVFLAAGLWFAWEKVQQGKAPRLRPFAFLAAEILAVCTVTLGLAPRLLSAGTGLEALPRSGVSAWGLGLLCVLPWLLGVWLVRAAVSATGALQRLRRSANLELLLGALGWLGRKLETAVYWLGSVGEGEGWWGWVLVILALGALYLAMR